MCALLIFAAAGCAAASAGAVEASAGGFRGVFYGNGFSPETEPAQGVSADISTAGDGYIGLAASGEKKIKARLCFGDITYTYTLPGDGAPCFLPLQSGSGKYELLLYENTVGDKYVQIGSTPVEADMGDEFAPFLHSNQMVSFTEDSLCVRKAAELAAEAEDENGFVKLVYGYICDNISYDGDLAATVAAGYLPEPDRTLERGKGICFDYASLAAAMLRSQGIPTKLITGYAGRDALYHAWNAVYLRESGWITVELRVSPGDWNRIDLTFAAAGEDETVYVDKYVY